MSTPQAPTDEEMAIANAVNALLQASARYFHIVVGGGGGRDILAALEAAGWTLVRKQATGKAEPPPTFEAAPANVTQLAPRK